MKHGDIAVGKTYIGKSWKGGSRKVLKIIHDEEFKVTIVICTGDWGYDKNEIYSLSGFASWAREECEEEE